MQCNYRHLAEYIVENKTQIVFQPEKLTLYCRLKILTIVFIPYSLIN